MNHTIIDVYGMVCDGCGGGRSDRRVVLRVSSTLLTMVMAGTEINDTRVSCHDNSAMNISTPMDATRLRRKMLKLRADEKGGDIKQRRSLVTDCNVPIISDILTVSVPSRLVMSPILVESKNPISCRINDSYSRCRTRTLRRPVMSVNKAPRMPVKMAQQVDMPRR